MKSASSRAPWTAWSTAWRRVTPRSSSACASASARWRSRCRRRWSTAVGAPEGYDVASEHVGSAEPGGDFHAVVQADDGAVVYFVCDVGGTGVPARSWVPWRGPTCARPSRRGRALRDPQEGQPDPRGRGPPRDVRHRARRAARPRDPRAGGGLRRPLPLVHWSAAEKAIRAIQPDGIALGFDKGPVFDRGSSTRRVPMDPGDRVLLAGTGAVRVIDHQGDEIGEKRLYKLFARNAPDVAEEALDGLLTASRPTRTRSPSPSTCRSSCSVAWAPPEPRSSRGTASSGPATSAAAPRRSGYRVSSAPRRAAMMAGRSTHERGRRARRGGGLFGPEPARAAPRRAPRSAPAAPPAPVAGYASVALNRPMRNVFTYGVPRELDERVGVGVRVSVPFAGRREIGVVVERVDRRPAARIKPLREVLDDEPAVGAEMLELGAGSRTTPAPGRGPRGRAWPRSGARAGARPWRSTRWRPASTSRASGSSREGPRQAAPGPAHSPGGGRPDPPGRSAQEARRHRRAAAPS